MQPEEQGRASGPLSLQEQLSHVRWIGGGSGAGKSTIATRLTRQHKLRLYATDDAMMVHGQRIKPEERPLINAFNAMDMDERWVNRSPEIMFETFHWFQGEGFRIIIEDLLSLPNDRLIIVEGFRLLPHLVRPLLAASDHAVWLLPTPEFRRGVMSRRGWPDSGFLAKTSNPEKALQNLLERDKMFTDHLYRETIRFKLPAIEIDSMMDEDSSVFQVAEMLGLKAPKIERSLVLSLAKASWK